MGIDKILPKGPRGTTFGHSATDYLSLYGVTPIQQRSGSAQTAVATTVSVSTTTGAITSWGYPTSTIANGIVTLVNELRAALVALGAIKGSA